MAASLSSLFAFSTGFRRISMPVLLWLLLLARVNAQNQSNAEVQTLLKFKYMTVVDTWVLSIGYYSTWKDTDTSPCTWWGVTCTTNNTVEKLGLSNWGLTALPSLGVLSNLTDLRELDLSLNFFRDKHGTRSMSIPDDVGSLVGLTHLTLSRSDFSGPIPLNISACRSLRYLNVEDNTLTGEIPDLSGLPNLQYLYLGGNQFSGSFPKWLGQSNSKILYIDLSGNKFDGIIPSLPNLTDVLEIKLDDNTFTAFEEPIFPGAMSLEHLSVKGNQLSGPIPSSTTKFLNLRIIDFSSNNFSGNIPSGFSLNMSRAINMDLSQNQLTGNIPENLLQPTTAGYNLPVLVLSNNLLTGPIPFHATKQYHYEILDFSNNNLSGPIPSICDSGSSIGQLWLQNNKLEGDIVDFLAQCLACITDLQLANNSFIGDLARLANISTDWNSVVRESTTLQTVDLSNNKLQVSTAEARLNPDPFAAVLEFFMYNTSVTDLRMQGNNFSGTPLPAYFHFPANSLLVLDLSNNHLMGQISGAAFNSTWLPALTSLNLSNNDLTGPIPEAIVMIPSLVALNVVNNSLSGPLPPILPERLNIPGFYSPGNGGLCGAFLQACSHNATGVQRWFLLVVIGGSVLVAVGSCLAVTWRWRVYHKIHQQDADLIKTLLERESAALMSLRELKKATNNFDESSQIGEGGFGIVYIGKLNDGTMVAIKRSKCPEGFKKDKDLFLNEVRILSRVNHRHLVKLLGCCMENKTALLVFEFVSNGTLQDHLQGKIGGQRLSWKQRLHIAIQTADALNYLHSAATFPIYHRDVKSANILLDNDLNAKVADFGISKLAPLEATHVSTIAIQGTIGYIDPEYYTSYKLTDKSDVYSFGVVLLELISGKPPIDFLREDDKTSLVNFANIHMENEDLHQLIDAALMETYKDMASPGRESILHVARLAMKCLNLRSKLRPSMHEVWKELQNMWLELEGTASEELSSIDDYDIRASPHDQTILLPFSNDSSSFRTLGRDAVTSIQMSLI